MNDTDTSARAQGTRSYDVVVVGAGTAGAAAAAMCAERGMRVLCVDRRPLDDAGARWVNGVPERSFIEAGVDVPQAPERRGWGDGFHLIAGWGPHRLSLTDHGVLEVDMRHLVTRLHERARRAGVELRGRTDVQGVDDDGVRTRQGLIRTRFVVDSSGLSGARLLDQPRVPAAHICTAAQEVREVSDSRAALDFCARHGIPVGEVACFTAIVGGFSIINVRTNGERVSILTGTIPASGQPSGKTLLARFVADNPWIGPVIFGGARAIPLRRPYDRLASERIALLGDAGCQVFPGHGSGIGIGMVAARMLADALSSGAGPHGYACAFQRKHGGLLATYDLLRRLSQTVSADDLERMMTSGLMDADTARFGMAQVMPKMTRPALASKVRALTRAPDLAWRMAATVWRIPVVGGIYARYPADPAQLPRWSRMVARLFAEPADIDL